MADFTLSQTVAGTWVITLPNPEERGWHTQLAEFDMTRVTPGTPSGDSLEMAAAVSLATIVSTMAGALIDEADEARMADLYEVTSHDDSAVTRMEAKVKKALAAILQAERDRP